MGDSKKSGSAARGKDKRKDPKGAAKPEKGPTIGLALGSGSARGWAHIGVIEALEDIGIKPDVVTGTSIGALVGAVYVSGKLPAFAKWVRKLTTRDVIGFLDISLSGGVVKGEKLFGFFESEHRSPKIESLKQRYASVATEMHTGKEVWITEGPILPAARASCAMPGLFTPVRYGESWMLDGGLVNPVPVSTCRALGADVVIAVNLNAQMIGTHFSPKSANDVHKDDLSLWQRVADYFMSSSDENPSFFDVIAQTVNVMQDRITRSRMAGDPPEVTVVPMLADFALMDFQRASEAIEEGRRIVREQAEIIRAWAKLPPPPDSADEAE